MARKISKAKSMQMSRNIRKYIHKGKPHKQAIAIAYSLAGLSRRKGRVNRARKGKR